ncbi:metallophosphoesterase family protein [Undibacterium danionis]|uniref:Metallophosphoesterase family protein n=1 Tax=Undibacterium danionis TaxID=1812100 RepID=A0ABV6IGN9_9BURK
MSLSELKSIAAGLESRLLGLQQRAKTALDKLKTDVYADLSEGRAQQAAILDLLKRAHQQAQRAMLPNAKREKNELPWELVHGLSALGLLNGAKPLPKTPEEFATIVRSDGTLLGCRQWELLDPRWAEALVEWLEHWTCRAPFVSNPVVLRVPNQLRLAIVGDWGTGPFEVNAASSKIANLVAKAKPDFSIHLGDVYYAGTNEQEQNNMRDWPQGMRGSFTLNSNHEMYNGAFGYFAELARNFPLQNGCSYFALENDDWLVIGLDTAYFSPCASMYMDGVLDAGQLAWLAQLPKDKRLLVLSHHEGYSALGDGKTALYQQVEQALGREPDYWYWGHLHNGICYQTIGNFRGRCVGHGAIPYGVASEFQGDERVVWYETELAGDFNYPERVLNGYALISLDGAGLSETLLGEDGSVRWKS